MKNEYDIVILGYGLVGNVAALLLGQLGIRAAVVEQKTMGDLAIAKAGRLDDEVMRIFQQLGLLAEVESVLYPLKGMQIIDTQGKMLLDFPHKALSEFAPMYGFYQPDLQRILQNAVRKHACIDVWCESKITVIDQQDEHLQLEIEHQTNKEKKSIKASYLIVCNGAASELPQQCGLQYLNYGFSSYTLNVDTFTQQPLRTPLYAQTIYNAEFPVTRITNNDRHQRWEFQLEEQDVSHANTPEEVRKLIAQLTDLEFDVHSVFLHKFDSKILKNWRDHHIFFAGDAAHTMPPYLGLGLSAGIKDVYNLVWKLHLVLENTIHTKILDSYKGEREPATHYLIKLNLWVKRLFRASRLRWIRWFVPVLPQFLLRRTLDTATWVQYGLVGGFSDARGWLLPSFQIRLTNNDLDRFDRLLSNTWVVVAFDANPIDEIYVQNLDYLAKIHTIFIQIVPQKSKFEPNQRFAKLVQDANGDWQQYLQQHKAKFLVVRPDKVIFDAARTWQELAKILELLQLKMPLAKSKIEEELEKEEEFV